MSRSQLYRKFESLTGMTPSDFIRSLRLKRAAQLLRGSQLTVLEISARVGFNSVKHFWQTLQGNVRRHADRLPQGQPVIRSRVSASALSPFG